MAGKFDGTIRIDTKLDTDGLNKNINNISKNMSGILRSMGGFGSKLADANDTVTALISSIGGLSSAIALGIGLAAVAALAAVVALFALIAFGMTNALKTMMNLKGYGESIKLQFENLRLAVSMAFQPLVTAALPYIMNVIQNLITLLNIVQMIWAALLGQKTVMRAVATSTGGAAGGAEKLADNTKKAGKAAEGALASFDELNVLAQETAQAETPSPQGGGAGGGIRWEEIPIDQGIAEKVQKVKDWFADLLLSITGFFNTVSSVASMGWTIITTIWGVAGQWFFSNVIEPIGSLFSSLWLLITVLWSTLSLWFIENVWNPIVAGHPWLAILNIARDSLMLIKSAWGTFFDWIYNVVFAPTRKGFQEMLDNIKNNWITLKEWFKNNVGSPLKEIFSNTIDYIGNSFKNGFNNILSVTVGFVNSIIDAMNKKIQGAVQSINGLIRSANNLGGMLPGWKNIPSISAPLIGRVAVPRLATGAVIPGGSPFLAMLGDQRGGQTNIEAPADLIRQIVREEIGSGQKVTINFGGTLGALVRELKPYIDQENMRIGNSLIDGMGT